MPTARKKMRYFDHAATTPLDPRVFRAMRPYLSEQFGNPSNLYALGRNAKQAILHATQKIACALHCSPGEFVFTGSATEADNLAIAGVARANRKIGNKIIVSNIEHKGILAICNELKMEGFEICELPAGKTGLIALKDLKKLLDKNTVLVSVTYADSETGTIQPIPEISRVVRNFRKQIANRKSHYVSASRFAPSALPYLHTDASQAAGYADINVEKLGVDLMTLSAHKLYGPKGIGGLYVRKGTNIRPIIYGGGQQGKLRSGTENVPAIVGFGETVRLIEKEKRAESARIKKLRDKLEQGIKQRIKKVVLNGHLTKRLPNFLNISILDVEGEAMLLYLDEKGIMVSTGSACNSESLEPSYVLSALGNPYEYIHGSIRFTLGRQTKLSDIDYVLKELPAIIKKLRHISPLNLKMEQKEKMSEPKAFIGNQTPHFLRKKSPRDTRRR